MLLKTTSVLLIALVLMSSQSYALDDICLQPKVVGPCRASLVRWYYDRKAKSCVEFDYGGCHGNENNFKTLRDCRKSCS